MKYKFEKDIRIVNEFMWFCHRNNSTELHVDISCGKEYTIFTIAAKINNMRQDKIASLRKALDVPRQHEIEISYWDLSGNSELGQELNLVGMMIDENTIEYDGDTLTITAKRKEI